MHLMVCVLLILQGIIQQACAAPGVPMYHTETPERGVRPGGLLCGRPLRAKPIPPNFTFGIDRLQLTQLVFNEPLMILYTPPRI